MRTTLALLAVAVIAVVVLSACRARDDGDTDSGTADTARPNDTAKATDPDTTTGASATLGPARRDTPRVVQRPLRRAGDSSVDAALPPDDSLRRMRPDMPQVTPEKRPRTWRGFKLPEEMPVRAPVETIKRVEQAPDSVTKGDSTKPPRPAR